MLFHQTKLKGAYVIDPEMKADHRGFFARTYCSSEFERQGIAFKIFQSSVAWNKSRFTLRGMHYQADPDGEDKLVQCTRGAIYDVIVDLRKSSATRGEWFATELTADNRKLLFVPSGFAHGYLTLVDDTEVSYDISSEYRPQSARGVRWNDERFKIEWPHTPAIIDERDKNFPLVEENF